MRLLADFIARHQRLFVLTGAGCSTDSGIPDYRDAEGGWKRAPPVTLQAFVGDESTRRRYWARSMLGWNRFGRASPNAVHRALVELERQGRQQVLLTQNVDRLHQRAGSRNVIDLHGRMDVVRCLACEARSEREGLQRELLARNPDWLNIPSTPAPDGDADLDNADFSTFDVPDCEGCGGVLKPDVVFFGENVPRERVDAAVAHLEQADAVLVVGSSLMVYSGFRFARMASAMGKPIAAVNLGRTRADDLLSLKITESCGDALAFLIAETEQAHGTAAISG
ncbi:NAD-dependent protein deacetylase [Dokdonella sp.]|uniref:NAD-dependent protein deacetylase n=1 Tax=Dokdonella sp. TaxID=2291710 RepID=UPI0035290323